jgi:hypothetical protein
MTCANKRCVHAYLSYSHIQMLRVDYFMIKLLSQKFQVVRKFNFIQRYVLHQPKYDKLRIDYFRPKFLAKIIRKIKEPIV